MRFALLLCLLAFPATADEPLSVRIDRLIAAKNPSPRADDAEFLRRVTLDLAGTVPTPDELAAFLKDADPAKRDKLIDRLLAGPGYARSMADKFDAMLMERFADDPAWKKWLHDSFAANKPWDAMTREILRAEPGPAAFWAAKRLENYGQNAVDYSGLARDVGRLFLGKNYQCCECHDHLTVEEYKQRDFQGLFAFYRNVKSAGPTKVEETPTVEKVTFASVFNKKPKETAPRVPGRKEQALPAKGQEWEVKPDPAKKVLGVPKTRLLKVLADELPRADTPGFSANIVNRVWFLFMGRGLVHPLDLLHAKNPASHPELLELLAKEFEAHKFDLKWLVGQLCRTEAYQRSSRLPPGETAVPPESFRTPITKRVSGETLYRAACRATGGKDDPAVFAQWKRAFDGPAREPEEGPAPSLKSALFLLNDERVLVWCRPEGDNLAARLAKTDDPVQAAKLLYAAMLCREPDADEVAAVRRMWERYPAGGRGPVAGRLVWSLLGSTEFLTNH